MKLLAPPGIVRTDRVRIGRGGRGDLLVRHTCTRSQSVRSSSLSRSARDTRVIRLALIRTGLPCADQASLALALSIHHEEHHVTCEAQNQPAPFSVLAPQIVPLDDPTIEDPCGTHEIDSMLCQIPLSLAFVPLEPCRKGALGPRHVKRYSSARRSAAAVANGASARAASSIAARIRSCGRPDRPMISPSTAPTPKISTGT